MATPRAIVIASAHWETHRPRVTGSAVPETIHDFGGFPQALYELRYPAPGSSEWAQRIVHELREHGFGDADVDPQRGLDHGAWVPLILMYPEAKVPVLQVSLRRGEGMQAHFELGRALAALRADGALIIGSGSATHNLMEIGRYAADQPPPAHVSAFNEWLADAAQRGDWTELAQYRARAPHGAHNHPSEEHIVPFAFAWGAVGLDAKPKRIHASYTYGTLSMDNYAFA